LRSSDFAAFVKMMQAMLEVWKRERPVPRRTRHFRDQLVTKELREPAVPVTGCGWDDAYVKSNPSPPTILNLPGGVPVTHKSIPLTLVLAPQVPTYVPFPE